MDIGRIEASLGLWNETAGGKATLVNHSENHSYRIDGPDGARHILRVHRPDYQSHDSIASELAWLGALQSDTELPVPRPLVGANGDLIQGLDPTVGGERLAVLFAFEPGHEPRAEDELEPLFETLGRYAAHLHNHVNRWTPPAGFCRQVWDAGRILDPDGLWGDWRLAPHVSGEVRQVLDCLDARLRAFLKRYGTTPNRFGLVHADMRLANLLVDGNHVTLIDFDDCGYCWFAYDFAAAVSFHEAELDLPALKRAWLAGYTPVRSLEAEDIAAMDAMVLLRRMALLAWIGSHAETDLAQAYADRFAGDSAVLAEQFLCAG